MRINADHPHLPEGEELGISGLCVVPNGGSVEVDAEDIRLWEEDTGLKLEDALKNNAVLSTGSEKPSTARKRFENQEKEDEELSEPELLQRQLEEGEGGEVSG